MVSHPRAAGCVTYLTAGALNAGAWGRTAGEDTVIPLGGAAALPGNGVPAVSGTRMAPIGRQVRRHVRCDDTDCGRWPWRSSSRYRPTPGFQFRALVSGWPWTEGVKTSFLPSIACRQAVAAVR